MNSAKNHYILGVDPGSLKAGFSLIEASKKSVQLVESGTVVLKQKEDFFSRIRHLNKEFNKMSEAFPSFELSLESLIHVKNVSSLSKLAQARGAIIGALSLKAISIHEYAPNLVKSTVSGYGLSSKESLEKSLAFMFPHHKFSTHDESDALAIALCHNFNRSLISLKSTSRVKSTKARTLKESLKHLAEK